MKLRIYGDSLRFRLGPQEVAQLAETGKLRAEIAFGPTSVLAYELITQAGDTVATATFDARTVLVTLSKKTVSDWARNDDIGIYANQATTDDRQLKIVIEKDFECLDEGGNEPDAIFYPNPRKEETKS